MLSACGRQECSRHEWQVVVWLAAVGLASKLPTPPNAEFQAAWKVSQAKVFDSTRGYPGEGPPARSGARRAWRPSVPPFNHHVLAQAYRELAQGNAMRARELLIVRRAPYWPRNGAPERLLQCLQWYRCVTRNLIAPQPSQDRWTRFTQALRDERRPANANDVDAEDGSDADADSADDAPRAAMDAAGQARWLRGQFDDPMDAEHEATTDDQGVHVQADGDAGNDHGPAGNEDGPAVGVFTSPIRFPITMQPHDVLLRGNVEVAAQECCAVCFSVVLRAPTSRVVGYDVCAHVFCWSCARRYAVSGGTNCPTCRLDFTRYFEVFMRPGTSTGREWSSDEFLQMGRCSVCHDGACSASNASTSTMLSRMSFVCAQVRSTVWKRAVTACIHIMRRA